MAGSTGADPAFTATPSVTSITITNAPTAGTDGANKAYVDLIAAGFEFKSACYAATTTTLNATYLNGIAGVGATLVNAGTLVAFAVDGTSTPITSRILVKDQSSTFQNGIYTLTTVGTGAIAWVLTRATDYDQVSEIQSGDLIPVVNGTVNADTVWLETATVATIGTDPIVFARFTSAPITTTLHAVLIGAANNGIASTAVGSTGQVLQGNTGADPTYSTATYPSASGGTGKILYDNGTNFVESTPTFPASASATSRKIIVSDGTNWVASTETYAVPGTSGNILTSNGTNWTSAAPATNGTVTSVSGTANQVAVATGTTTPVISLIGPYTPATYTAHGVLIGEGTSSIAALAAGSAGQVLQSGGASADPAYSTPTYPSVSGTSRKILVSDGTNNVYSTETWAVPGTNGNVLTSNGTNWTSTLPIGAMKVVTQVFTGNGTYTYTPTTSMQYCIIEVIGAGGGGGGCPATAAGTVSAGGGGGAGGYARKTVTSATIGGSQTITIGAGGAGGVGNAAGSAGTTSSVGAIVSATGGNGGANAAAAGVTTVNGGSPGIGSSGDINISGGAGYPSFGVSSGGPAIASGSGGIANLGGGSVSISGTSTHNNGNVGQNYGSGGSGGGNTNSQSAANGGAGADGIVVITEFIGALPSTGTQQVSAGGTGATTLTAHGVLIGEGVNAISATAAGSAGQVLQSGGASADPTYSTPTYPSASGTSRKILVSDGTNNVYSTETWAVPGTSGNLLTSDGTNWTSATPTTSGTFTPTAIGTSTAGTTTYSTQAGYYRRVGAFVYTIWDIGGSAATGTGNWQFGSAPFTNANSSNNVGWGAGIFLITASWGTSKTNAGAAIQPNTTTGNFQTCANGSNTGANIVMANTSFNFAFSLGYII